MQTLEKKLGKFVFPILHSHLWHIMQQRLLKFLKEILLRDLTIKHLSSFWLQISGENGHFDPPPPLPNCGLISKYSSTTCIFDFFIHVFVFRLTRDLSWGWDRTKFIIIAVIIIIIIICIIGSLFWVGWGGFKKVKYSLCTNNSICLWKENKAPVVFNHRCTCGRERKRSYAARSVLLNQWSDSGACWRSGHMTHLIRSVH